MSSVRARSARTAPAKKIHDEYEMTGKLSSNSHTSSRRPNGAGAVKPSTLRPTGDPNHTGPEPPGRPRDRATKAGDNRAHRQAGRAAVTAVTIHRVTQVGRRRLARAFTATCLDATLEICDGDHGGIKRDRA